MRNLRALVLSAFAVWALPACAADPGEDVATRGDDGEDDEDIGTVSSGAIIGDNDLVPVVRDGENVAEKYRPLINAFGRLSMGCTGTHVGDGIVITAGHCFNAPSTRVNNRPCGNRSIVWGWRRDRAPYLRSQCTTILAMEQSYSRDYAILRVTPAPPVSITPRFDAYAANGTQATIFSHPRSRPLEWSGLCFHRTSSSSRDRTFHQCDTEPGSSGAAVLDDGALDIVAIHGGAMGRWNYATALASTPLGEYL